MRSGALSSLIFWSRLANSLFGKLDTYTYRGPSEPLKPLKTFILDGWPLKPLKRLLWPLMTFNLKLKPLFLGFSNFSTLFVTRLRSLHNLDQVPVTVNILALCWMTVEVTTTSVFCHLLTERINIWLCQVCLSCQITTESMRKWCKMTFILPLKTSKWPLFREKWPLILWPLKKKSCLEAW